jgi:hypothetical protein
MAFRPGSSPRTDALGRAYQGTAAHALRAVDVEPRAPLVVDADLRKRRNSSPGLKASETEDVAQSIEEGINDMPPGEPPPEER